MDSALSHGDEAKTLLSYPPSGLASDQLQECRENNFPFRQTNIYFSPLFSDYSSSKCLRGSGQTHGLQEESWVESLVGSWRLWSWTARLWRTRQLVVWTHV